MATGILRKVYIFRKTLVTILTPLLLLPLLILPQEESFTESACAYTILLMAIYWVTEVVPLAVTALLPLVLYPLLGVLPAKTVSVQYLKDVNILFLGGLTVAVAVEHWNLHKRIALKVLTLVGAKPKWLLFGFMVTTAFLSMWISNVATTAMMIPIAQAVLTEMSMGESDESADSGCNTPEEQPGMNPNYNHAINYNQHASALVSEMGNIGEAKELGQRLASNNKDEVPEWALSPKSANNISAHYSKNDYAPVDGSNNPMLGSPDNMFPTEATQCTLTIPEQDGPDTSTTQLVHHSILKNDLSDFDDKKNAVNRTQGLNKALTICVCYSANIGGTATLTGTGPNLIMAGQFKTTYPDAPEVDFGSWAVYAFPSMVLFLLFTWVWLQYLFLHLSVGEIFLCCRRSVSKSVEELKAERVIHRQYKDLGPMSFAEIEILILFIVLALLWLSRDPGFVSGWSTLPIFKDGYVTDATMAMLISFLLFILPSRPPNVFCGGDPRSNEEGPVPPLLTWKVVQQKMAWNVILLLGGGFAMALGSKASGLSAWIGTKLEPLNSLSPSTASFICCLVICALTQCTSNTATATVFIPILAELAEILHVNPLYLLLPATVVTSYAFMLPVSTPPNAIAYSYGHLKMKDMIKAGSLLNLVGIAVVIFSINTMGDVAFGVSDNCPSWLHSDYCNDLRNNATLAGNVTLATVSNVNATSIS